MPSLVLAPLTIMFSRYLCDTTQDSLSFACQWRTATYHCLLFVPAQSAILLCVSPILIIRALKPHSCFKPLSTRRLKFFCSAWQRFSHYSLGLLTTSTGFQPVQVLLSQTIPDDFFTHNKGDANSLVSLVPSLANLSVPSCPGIPRWPGIHTKSDFIRTTWFF